MSYTAQIEDCPGWWLLARRIEHYQDGGGSFIQREAVAIGTELEGHPSTVAFTQDPQAVVGWIKDGKLPE